MRVDFWTSVAGTAYLRELAEALAPHGFELRPRFELRQARYWQVRGRAGRLALRFRTYVVYPLRVAWDFARHDEPRVAVVASNTFFAPWLAARLGGRRRRVIHLVYDLYPETLLHAGAARPGGMIERLLRALMRDTFRRAAANVFLGERLAVYACRTYGDAAIRRPRVIPVGTVAGPFRDWQPAPRPAGWKPVILYCGNLGHMHEVDTVAHGLLTAAAASNVRWRFHATGAGFDRLRARLAAEGPSAAEVTLGGNLPDDRWAAVMKDADVALVTMRPGAEQVLVPSKTYSALLAGQAILAVCPPDSDLSEIVRRHACGWVVAPGDHAGFAAAVAAVASDPDGLLHRRMQARHAGETACSLPALAAAWAELLRECA